MYPILALAEVLTEGLVFFRRASTVYRVANTVEGVSDAIDSLTGDKLRHHTSVKGDDAYLWLLGKGLMNNIYSSIDPTPPDAKQVIKVPLQALVHNQFVMTSPDAKSMVNSYLYALGAEWQRSDDEAYNKMLRLFDSIRDKFIVADPIWTMFSQDVDLSNEEVDLMDELGADRATFRAVKQAFKDGIMNQKWNNILTRTGSADKPVYKVETAIGTMIEGAKSVLPSISTEIPFSTDNMNQGFSLNAGYMFRTPPAVQHHEMIRRGTAINKEMTDMMSRKMMEARGYVKVAGGDWKQLDETQITMVKKTPESEAVPTFVENQAAGLIETLSSQAENKLSAMARLNRIKNLIKK